MSVPLCLLLACLVAAAQPQRVKRAPREGTPPSDQLFEAGDRLAEQQRWDEAVKAYRLAVSFNPKAAAEAHVRIGDALMGAGKWEEARAAYQQAIKLDDKNADAHYALGKAYNDMGQHGDAFAPLVRAVQLDPGVAEAHHGIGHAYLMTDQYAKALPYFRGALRLSPDHAEARHGLALAYLHLGNRAALEDERKKLATLDGRLSKLLDKQVSEFDAGAGGTPARETAAADRTQSPPRRDTAVARTQPPSQTPAAARTQTATPPPAQAARVAGTTQRPSAPAAPKGNGQPAETAERRDDSSPAAPRGRGNISADKGADYELSFWDTIKNSTDPEDFKAYLKKYPDGVFADLARRRANTSAGTARPAPLSSSKKSATSTSPTASSSANTSPPAVRSAAARPSSSSSNIAVESTYKGLKPGASTREEAEKILGAPLSATGAGGTMVEYSAQAPARRVFVDYRPETFVVKQIILYFAEPPARAALIRKLQLGEQPDAAKNDKKGRLIEYFGGPPAVALTHAGAEPGSGLFSLSYISQEAFNSAAGLKPAKKTSAKQAAVAPRTAAASSELAKGTPPAPAPPAAPSYDDLTRRAWSAWEAKDNAGAVRLSQEAIRLDASRAEAFQTLGIVQLYGNRDFGAAAGAMSGAVARGGMAAFGVKHDHGGRGFSAYCQGTLQVTKSGVSYRASDGAHSFQASAADIKEARLNALMGVALSAFHIKVAQGQGKTENYNFAPGTSQVAESNLILSLMPAR